MTSPRYAELAARAISQDARDADDADVAPPSERRARDVAAIAIALKARRRRLRNRRIMGGVAVVVAAAASVAFVVTRHSETRTAAHAPPAAATASPMQLTLVGHPGGAGASTIEDGRESPLVDGVKLVKGSRIVTHASGSASLALSTGTKITMTEDSQLSVDEDSERQVFGVAAGTMRAQVAKLTGAQRFIVRTSDAEVEVRGTVFRVSQVPSVATGGDGTPTRVVVEEGVVVVRHRGSEVRVAAGETWPANCAPAEPVATKPSPTVRAERRVGTSLPTPFTAAESASRLGEQNDMFARAMGARRAGRNAEAASGFETLIALHPKGPLTENATVERMRALRALDPARGKVAAREYLARYPNGFARAEAEAIVVSEK